MVGILGGTFDPVHDGHLHIAAQVQSALALPVLQFLPCAIPVHRHAPQVDANHRLRMLELAIAPHPGFEINALELERSGPSYMVDTLTELKSRQPDQCLCLILGADAFNHFESWKQSEKILTLAHLVICQRPGVALRRDIYPDRWVATIEQLRASAQPCILPLTVSQSACSSTAIRQSLATGADSLRCLPAAVAAYIFNHHLYENQCD